VLEKGAKKMPGIWIFSEENDTARQLITAGSQLKAAMCQSLGVVTLEAAEAEGFIAAGADKVVVVNGDSRWP